MWVASCACCNPAISAVTPPGSSSAPWRSSWPWAFWEVFPDEPPHPGPHPAAGRVPHRPLPAALVFGADQPLLGARQFARHFRRLARPACLVRPRCPWRAVPARRALDLYSQHSLRHLREWRQPVSCAFAGFHLEFGLVGVFLAQDLFLFYVFWEVCLVPMYFLIGIWGHDRRIYAAVKFFLYTMAGSVLMLAAIIYIYNKTLTFSYPAILEMLANGRLTFPAGEQMLLFLAFFVAFAIKVPLFPLHTWLPAAPVEARPGGSVMLASVVLKMGTFGILHYCLPLFPVAARQCAPWIAVLAIIGIIYGALVAMVQPNMKKLVAYSSVSHLGFVVLGIFSFTQMGLDGAVYQMLSHGIT